MGKSLVKKQPKANMILRNLKLTLQFQTNVISEPRIEYLGQLIPPGIIKDSMKIIENHKDIVLMADCKRLAKGLRSDRMGDVDLWGHEKPPILQQKLNKFWDECNHINISIESLPNASLLDVHDNMKYLLKLITTRIRDVRENWKCGAQETIKLWAM